MIKHPPPHRDPRPYTWKGGNLCVLYTPIDVSWSTCPAAERSKISVRPAERVPAQAARVEGDRLASRRRRASSASALAPGGELGMLRGGTARRRVGGPALAYAAESIRPVVPRIVGPGKRVRARPSGAALTDAWLASIAVPSEVVLVARRPHDQLGASPSICPWPPST